MSRINEIEKELVSISSINFEKLCEAYFKMKNYNVISGSVITRDKSKKGRPDLLIINENQKYIFIECNTDINLKIKKLKSDFLGCLKVFKSKNKISKIILCYNYQINTKDIDSLIELSKVHNIEIELIDITILAQDICWNYPVLAKEYLSMTIDTNQILTPFQFSKEYNKNLFAVSLENNFMFRERELSQCIDLLKSNDLLLIKGDPGVGKTKFALKLQEEFSKYYSNCVNFVVMDKGIDALSLYEDTILYFKNDNNYIIVIDDANRSINNFKILLNLLRRDSGTIKIIATVRNYAINSIHEAIEGDYKYDAIDLKNFNREELEGIIKSQYNFNYNVIDRIFEITKGNVRLAMMCAGIAKRTNNYFSLYNVCEVFESYYGNIFVKFTKHGSIKLLKILGLLSFLRIIRIDDTALFIKLENFYKIDKNEFWESVLILNTMELLDVYEKTAVKYSDQTFQTYIFYKVFFDLEILNYGDLILHFSNDFNNVNKIIDTLNPILSNFNFTVIKNKLKVHLAIWLERYKNNNEIILKIYKIYWFVEPLIVLRSIEEKVSVMPKSKTSINYDINRNKLNGHFYHTDTDEYFDILTLYHASDELFLESLRVLFIYLSKKPALYSTIINYFITTCIYKKDSHLNNYITQYNLIKYLIDEEVNAKEKTIYRNILFEISHTYLETSRNVTWQADMHSVTWSNVMLHDVENIRAIRKMILTFVISKYDSLDYRNKAISFLNKYIHPAESNIQKSLYIHDTSIIISFISRKLDPNEFVNCLFVNDYIQFINKRLSVSKYDKFSIKYQNDNYKLYLKLKWERNSEIKSHTPEFDKYIVKKMNIDFKNYDLKKCKYLINNSRLIIEKLPENEIFQIRNSLLVILKHFKEINLNLFYEVVKYILIKQNDLKIEPFKLFEQNKKMNLRFYNKLYNLLISNNYVYKPLWLLEYYNSLPVNYVNRADLLGLYNLLRMKEWSYICIVHIELLLKFSKIEKDVFSKIIKILINRSKMKSCKVNFYYILLFLEENDSMLRKNKEILPLVKQMYLYQVSVDKYDYSKKIFQFILSLDPEFLMEYLNIVLKDKEYLSSHDEYGDFHSLWDLKNYDTLINKALDYCFKKTKYYITESFQNVFFEKQPYTTKTRKFVEKYIKVNIKNIDKLNYIFMIINNIYPVHRIELIKYIFKVNSKFNKLDKLNLNSTSGFKGSILNLYQERKVFWNQLKEELIKIKQLHTLSYINEEINSQESQIRNELLYLHSKE